MNRMVPAAVLLLAIVAAAVLGVLAYRAGNSGGEASADPLVDDAIALFEAGHARGATTEERRRAEEAAERLRERGDAPEKRALGSNLVGVLAYENGALDPASAAVHVPASAGAFREAIHLDPGNDDAKFNLELVLTLPPEDAGAATGPGSGAGPSSGSGAGATPPGGGY